VFSGEAMPWRLIIFFGLFLVILYLVTKYLNDQDGLFGAEGQQMKKIFLKEDDDGEQKLEPTEDSIEYFIQEASKNECHDINTASSKFVVTHCLSPKNTNNLITGFFNISVNSCGENEIKFTLDSEMEELINLHVGPDAIRIRMVGPEIVMARQIYKGNCSYHFFYQLRHKGKYFISFLQHYERYNAVNEVDNKFPQFSEKTLIEHANYAFNFETGTHNLFEKITFLPTFLDTFPEIGRYQVKTYPEIDERLKRQMVIHDEKEIKDIDSVEWIPFDISKRINVDFETFSSCLMGKKWIFLGDSQSRTNREEILTILKDIYNNERRSKKLDLKKLDWDGFQFVWNQYGDLRVLKNVTDSDIISINFGQHPAARHHWTFSHYKEQIKLYSEAFIKDFESRIPKPKYFWVTSVPFYPNTLKPTVYFKDWRTETRIQIFNNIATTQMKLLRVEVVDAFQFAFPLTEFGGPHYGRPIQGNIVTELLNHVCKGNQFLNG